MSIGKQILSTGRRKRLVNWQMPVLATATLLGLTGQALHLPFELCLAAVVAWQFLAVTLLLAPWRR